MKGFTIFLLLFLAISLSAEEKWRLHLEKVSVNHKKPNGKYWDVWRGAPDLKVMIFVQKGSRWSSEFLTFGKQNAYSIQKSIDTKIEVAVGTKIKFEVFDKDVGKHDLAGRNVVTIAASHLQGNNDIQFEAVNSFVFRFTKVSSGGASSSGGFIQISYGSGTLSGGTAEVYKDANITVQAPGTQVFTRTGDTADSVEFKSGMSVAAKTVDKDRDWFFIKGSLSDAQKDNIIEGLSSPSVKIVEKIQGAKRSRLSNSSATRSTAVWNFYTVDAGLSKASHLGRIAVVHTPVSFKKKTKGSKVFLDIKVYSATHLAIFMCSQDRTSITQVYPSSKITSQVAANSKLLLPPQGWSLNEVSGKKPYFFFYKKSLNCDKISVALKDPKFKIKDAARHRGRDTGNRRRRDFSDDDSSGHDDGGDDEGGWGAASSDEDDADRGWGWD